MMVKSIPWELESSFQVMILWSDLKQLGDLDKKKPSTFASNRLRIIVQNVSFLRDPDLLTIGNGKWICRGNRACSKRICSVRM